MMWYALDHKVFPSKYLSFSIILVQMNLDYISVRQVHLLSYKKINQELPVLELFVTHFKPVYIYIHNTAF